MIESTMADVVISIGVHANEVNARRSVNESGETYAEELKRLLEAKGHKVTIVNRPESSTKQVLEFNYLKQILNVLDETSCIHPGSVTRSFIDSLTPAELDFLHQMNSRRDVKMVLHGYQEEMERSIKLFGLKLAKKLKPLFEKHPTIVEKSWIHHVIGSYVINRLSLDWQRLNDHNYRHELSLRYPNAHIIDLHNSGPLNEFDRGWKFVHPNKAVAVKTEDILKNYPPAALVGSHGKRGRPHWITVEIRSPRKQIVGPMRKRFYKEPNYSVVSGYEMDYGGHFHPPNVRETHPTEIRSLSAWAHNKIKRKKVSSVIK